MDVFEWTRALVDIESVTGNERAVGEFLLAELGAVAQTTGGRVEPMEVEPGRFNVLATWGRPSVTMSTHMDTVPPFFPSSEDSEYIWGRGSCDAKGIIAAMIGAAKQLLAEGRREFGLLFVVGEEKDSRGAHIAAQLPRSSRHLINGEPTENRLALGSKGALRCQIVAQGRAAHSAYPELGSSAIETLLDVLQDIRKAALPSDSLLGKTTLNIGTIAGGRAPNVIADHAEAEVMVRLVGDAMPVREAIAEAVRGRATVHELLHTPALRLEAVDGLPTTVVAFTTDIPNFAGAWGKPLLIGPGTIHLAHTAEERIPKRELLDAVQIYAALARKLGEGDRGVLA